MIITGILRKEGDESYQGVWFNSSHDMCKFEWFENQIESGMLLECNETGDNLELPPDTPWSWIDGFWKRTIRGTVILVWHNLLMEYDAGKAPEEGCIRIKSLFASVGEEKAWAAFEPRWRWAERLQSWRYGVEYVVTRDALIRYDLEDATIMKENERSHIDALFDAVSEEKARAAFD